MLIEFEGGRIPIRPYPCIDIIYTLLNFFPKFLLFIFSFSLQLCMYASLRVLYTDRRLNPCTLNFSFILIFQLSCFDFSPPQCFSSSTTKVSLCMVFLDFSCNLSTFWCNCVVICMYFIYLFLDIFLPCFYTVVAADDGY